MQVFKGHIVLIFGDRCLRTRFGRSIIIGVLGVFAVVILGAVLLPLQFSFQQRDRILRDDIARLTQNQLRIESSYNKKVRRHSQLAILESELSKLRLTLEKINPNLSGNEVRWWIEEAVRSANLIEHALNPISRERLRRSADEWSLPVGSALLLSMGALESNFETNARSHRGAIGGMQMMRRTAYSLGITDLLNPRSNIRGGREYLVRLLRQFAPYEDQLELALASYNAGPTRVHERWMPTWGKRWNDIYAGLARQKRSFSETRTYTYSAVSLAQLFTSGNWISQKESFWYSFRSHLKRQGRRAFAATLMESTGG